MTETKGIALSAYTEKLYRVGDEFQGKPVLTFDLEERLGEKAIKYLRDCYDDMPLLEAVRRLPLSGFEHLTFDELCKVKYSSCIMMSDDVEKSFEEGDLHHHVLMRKIMSSMWRWGTSSRKWNEVVDAYEGILRFDLPMKDFEVRLDFTDWWHAFGRGRSSNVWLDGVFAYLIYYRGKHVMTLGFSVAKDRKLLVQQIQLRERRGNRWLYKLPSNYVEFFLGLFRESFPDHQLHVVDGGAIAKKNLDGYINGYRELRESIKRQRERVARSDEKYIAEEKKSLLRYRDMVPQYREKIAHLKADQPRLRALYGDTGRFALGEPFVINGLKHYPVAA